ncbi:hypothetical protein JCM30760_26450 [Thiomicrorhabdus hydrogeniphila]
MCNVLDFEVLEANTAQDIQKLVKDKISNGWELHGGLLCVPISSKSPYVNGKEKYIRNRYSQAMILTKSNAKIKNFLAE